MLTIKGHVLTGEAPTICVPIVSKDAKNIISDVKEARDKGASMIELRADGFEMLYDTAALLRLLEEVKELCRDVIVLFTVRTIAEGGGADISGDKYIGILKDVAKSKTVDIADLELNSVADAKGIVKELHDLGVPVCISKHDFDKTADMTAIRDIYEKMHDTGADILKIAMMAKSKSDVLSLMLGARQFLDDKDDKCIIAISMGDLGMLSRVAAGYAGSCVTFASVKGASAPGQLSLEDTKKMLELCGGAR